MPRLTLTDARVRALKPRKSTYQVRDAKLQGFGVRVLPSGTKRFFLHTQHRGQRSWHIVGDAKVLPVAAARSRATSLSANLRGNAPVDAPSFEAVAEAVFRRYARVWKPRTLYVNRSYYRSTLAPWFTTRPVADINRQEVERWFASLRGTPVSADRSMPVLSVILTEAERMGHRPEGSNPCRGIRRYRRKGRERYLSDEEIRRLGARLSAHEAHWPLQVAVVRLLLLTGCRHGEVLTLRWADYREGRLFLRDSKSGPRTVWLSGAARKVLDAIERERAWVFPACRGSGPANSMWLRRFWHRVRIEADLPDVRLHDLRHAHASFALRQGESVLAIARLLGHRAPATTLKYTHSADAMVREAAEMVGEALGG